MIARKLESLAEKSLKKGRLEAFVSQPHPLVWLKDNKTLSLPRNQTTAISAPLSCWAERLTPSCTSSVIIN